MTKNKQNKLYYIINLIILTMPLFVIIGGIANIFNVNNTQFMNNNITELLNNLIKHIPDIPFLDNLKVWFTQNICENSLLFRVMFGMFEYIVVYEFLSILFNVLMFIPRFLNKNLKKWGGD